MSSHTVDVTLRHLVSCGAKRALGAQVVWLYIGTMLLEQLQEFTRGVLNINIDIPFQQAQLKFEQFVCDWKMQPVRLQYRFATAFRTYNRDCDIGFLFVGQYGFSIATILKKLFFLY